MGQEVAVNAVQLASAASAVINGGLLMKPRIVKDIRSMNGEVIKSFHPMVRRRVISKSVSNDMRSILKRVVLEGTGRRAQVKNGTVGGKTGTAQKIEPNGAYSHDHFIGSFVGFLERGEQIVTILVSIDDPQPLYYGGTVAAPVFAKMAETVLEYSTMTLLPRK